MILYHGSNNKKITTLVPKLADHDHPYIYLSTLEVVAAFYLCNAVKKPYYWFPYGFTKENTIPVYHELYKDALKEVSQGVKGCIYKVDVNEKDLLPFNNNPHARLSTSDIEVSDFIEVEDAYELFLDYAKEGKMKISRFEDKTEDELNNWYEMIYNYIKNKDMINNQNCSYALFVKNKFPHIWDKYMIENM